MDSRNDHNAIEEQHSLDTQHEDPVVRLLYFVIRTAVRALAVPIVLATGLMAVVRKVVGFDYDELGWEFVLATGIVVLALGVTYWMVARHEVSPTH